MVNDGVGNKTYLTELDIRLYMRDNDPDANILLQDYEYDAEEVRTCMTLTVDKWNETPPALNTHSYDVDTFPFRGELLRGTCANLLFVAAMRFRRNELKANVPGGLVNDQGKYKQYDEAGDKMWKEYTDWIVIKKRSINMELGWGLIH